jgi:hypothetical protein
LDKAFDRPGALSGPQAGAGRDYQQTSMKSKMKKNILDHMFELPILVVILALACPPIARAQQSDFAAFDGHAVEAIDQLQDMSETADAVEKYDPPTRLKRRSTRLLLPFRRT